jgi:hypothetical protein
VLKREKKNFAYRDDLFRDGDGTTLFGVDGDAPNAQAVIDSKLHGNLCSGIADGAWVGMSV